MLKRSSPPVGAKGNEVKHLAKSQAEPTERSLTSAPSGVDLKVRVAQDDTIAVGIYINVQLLCYYQIFTASTNPLLHPQQELSRGARHHACVPNRHPRWRSVRGRATYIGP